MAKSTKDLQTMIRILDNICKLYGQTISIEKTVVLASQTVIGGLSVTLPKTVSLVTNILVHADGEVGLGDDELTSEEKDGEWSDEEEDDTPKANDGEDDDDDGSAPEQSNDQSSAGDEVSGGESGEEDDEGVEGTEATSGSRRS